MSYLNATEEELAYQYDFFYIFIIVIKCFVVGLIDFKYRSAHSL